MAEPAHTDEPSPQGMERERERLVGLLRAGRAWSGLGLLSVYLVYHLWEHWPAFRGVEAWHARVAGGVTGPTVAALVALVMVLHGCVGLGLALAGKSEAAPNPGDPHVALRPVRITTGVMVLGFLVYHLFHVGFAESAPHQTLRAAFGILWQDLGRPVPLVIYVFGVSAACLHLALGLSRAVAHRSHGRPTRQSWLLLAVGGSVGLVWLMFMELLALFAIGDGLWPG